MSREWKPGDVAMVAFYAQGLPVSTVGVRTTYEKVGADVWWTSRGWVGDHSAKFVRPLVVLDPEDREAVERLSSLVEANGGPRFGSRGVDSLVAALREYANPKPPRPDEPQGLGAVVEDEDGSLLIRNAPTGSRPWVTMHGATFDWSEIDAVRVLSPGVEVDQ